MSDVESISFTSQNLYRETSIQLYDGTNCSVAARASDSQLEKVGSNVVCAFKHGTLSYLLHLWTDVNGGPIGQN